MIIDLRTIAREQRSFRFLLEQAWWRPDEGRDQLLGIDTPIEVKIKIYRAGDKYVLDGDLSGGLQVLCDRCLEPYHWELRSAFRVFLALPIGETDRAEVELAEEDLEVNFIRGEEIDLDEIIREQIYLSLPMKSLCRENCTGLCPTCGNDLNAGNCQCHREQGHPAFLKLKNLKIEGE
jgi:uncharacterized protein